MQWFGAFSGFLAVPFGTEGWGFESLRVHSISGLILSRFRRSATPRLLVESAPDRERIAFAIRSTTSARFHPKFWRCCDAQFPQAVLASRSPALDASTAVRQGHHSRGPPATKRFAGITPSWLSSQPSKFTPLFDPRCRPKGRPSRYSSISSSIGSRKTASGAPTRPIGNGCNCSSLPSTIPR